MKGKRLLVPLAGLAISFALPTYAQQKDVADPQTTQKILALCKANDEAHMNNDATAVATLFTREAVLVTTDDSGPIIGDDSGPITGRPAIQKWYTDLWLRWHPKNNILKVDGNAFHWIGTAGNALWATGEASAIGQGETDDGKPVPEKPIPQKTHWLVIYVREGEDWKIQVSAWTDTAASVILANKAFASQPAATPSPTACPSKQ